MKIFLVGGTGFVGNVLAEHLAAQGHEITILSRSDRSQNKHASQKIRFLKGDPNRTGAWQKHIPDHHAVINLAGRSIFCRWTPVNKKDIEASRIRVSINIVDALRQFGADPASKTKVLINASAVGYYGGRSNERLTESSSPGNDYLSNLVQRWEQEALIAQSLGIRVALCRFGVILGKGGALAKMIPAYKAGIGSPLGDGAQWFPWIHIKDICNIIDFILAHDTIYGPINCTAPEVVTNRQLSQFLARAVGIPALLPAIPASILRFLLGEAATLILSGQYAMPAKLLDLGFHFQFPSLRKALAEIFNK